MECQALKRNPPPIKRVGGLSLVCVGCYLPSPLSTTTQSPLLSFSVPSGQVPAKAESEPMVQPHCVTDNLGRKSVTSIAGFHARIVADYTDLVLT